MSGTYNFGFFGVKNCDNAKEAISWWVKKLETLCVVKHHQGIFVDQKWMDLIPARYDKVFILKDAGYNTAYWNLSHRTPTYVNGKFYFNGSELAFFHFSGFNPTKLDVVSKHQDRFTMDDIGIAKKLFLDYSKDILNNGYKGWQSKKYSYNNFSDGRMIYNIFRYIYREYKPVRDLLNGRNPFNCADVF